MRHGSNTRRPRGRGNGKRFPGTRSYLFESNGPEVKIRGTAQQVLERYLALARDAASAGEHIAAEGYFQHAEHYYRIIHADSHYGHGRGVGQGQQPAAAPPPVPGQPAYGEQPATAQGPGDGGGEPDAKPTPS
jgi:hypothetical protein